MSYLDRIKRLIRSSKIDEVIPDDAPWWYRWSWVGVLAWLRYFHLSFLLDRESGDLVSSRTLCAAEDFVAAKFACIYGCPGNATLQTVTTEAERLEIASRRELRCLIRYHDLWNCGDGGARLRVPEFAAHVGSGALAFVLVSAIFLLALVATAPILLPWKLMLAAGTLCVFGAIGWSFYDCSVRAYRIAQRLRSDVERLIRAVKTAERSGGLHLVE